MTFLCKRNQGCAILHTVGQTGLIGLQNEISKVPRNTNHSNNFEHKELIAEADVDGDGNINYEEFVGTIFKGVINNKYNVANKQGRKFNLYDRM